MKLHRANAAGGKAFLPHVYRVTLALLLAVVCLLILLHIRPQPGSVRWRLRSATVKEAGLPAIGIERPTGAVPVNTADVQALTAIPGVGTVLAEAIVAERLENGLFYYPEDLLCVRGIGEKTLQKLLPYLNLD